METSTKIKREWNFALFGLSLIILLMIGTNYAFFPLRDGILFIIVTDAILGIGVYYYIQQLRLAHLDYLECEANGLTWWNQNGKQVIRFDEITSITNRKLFSEIVVKSDRKSVVIPKYADQFHLLYEQLEEGVFNFWGKEINKNKMIFKTNYNIQLLQVVLGLMGAIAYFVFWEFFVANNDLYWNRNDISMHQYLAGLYIFILLIRVAYLISTRQHYLLFPEALMTKTITGAVPYEVCKMKAIKWSKKQEIVIYMQSTENTITIQHHELNIPIRMFYRFLVKQYELKEQYTI